MIILGQLRPAELLLALSVKQKKSHGNFVFLDKCDNSRHLGLTVSPLVAAPRLSEKQRPESSIIAFSEKESASP